jgi:hypothetical protein
MAKQIIGTGSIANDGTGDTLKAAADKINQNFDELYKPSQSETITSAGAISLSNKGFTVFNNAGAMACTLGNDSASVAQKTLINVGAGLVTLTPTSFINGTSLTIAQNGIVDIVWAGGNWMLNKGDSDGLIGII